MSRATPPIDNTIDIVTPENIAFPYRLAGPFRRLPAYLLDLLLRAFLFGSLVWILSFASILMGPLVFPILIIVWFVLDWFYGGLFETFMNGQTPGKWLLGIRVLTIDGEPINGMQAVMRNILRVVDMTPMLSFELFGAPIPAYVIPTFVTGLVAASLNRRFQRLGDLVCGTMVVIEERRRLTGVARLEDRRAAQLAAYVPADYQVSRSLAQALAAYVDRRRYFSPARRREVARHLAAPLLKIFGLPADTSYDLLLCAVYYRTFIADRGEDDAAGPSPPRLQGAAASPLDLQGAGASDEPSPSAPAS